MALFLDGFGDGPAVRFVEVLKDLRILLIFAIVAAEFGNLYCEISAARLIGVFPYLSGALGLSVKGAKILTISVCPFHAAAVYELEYFHIYLEH